MRVAHIAGSATTAGCGSTSNCKTCLASSDGPDAIHAIFKEWQSKGVTILREPHDAGFGPTFLAADPDGNRIRVAPRG